MLVKIGAILVPAARTRLPFCKRLHHYGKSQCLMGKLTISMASFYSFVKSPEGNHEHKTNDDQPLDALDFETISHVITCNYLIFDKPIFCVFDCALLPRLVAP